MISDTHIPQRAPQLPRALVTALQGVDLILHAGDILVQEVLDDLGRIAPVMAVHGNVDPPELADRLPAKRVLELNGHVVGLTHGHGGRPGRTPEEALNILREDRCECIVFGHSHQPFNSVVDGIILFNPGSPTDKRREPYPTFGVLQLRQYITSQVYRLEPRSGAAPVEGMHVRLAECKKEQTM